MFWTPVSWWLDLLRRGKILLDTDEDTPEERATRTCESEEGCEPDDDLDPGDSADDIVPQEIPVPMLPRIVGAWAGSASYASSKASARDVAFAKAIGLRRLDVMVNDHSLWRQPHEFTTKTKSSIVELGKRVVGEGLELHFTTWCMPHRVYLEMLVDRMAELVMDTGATSVMLDAEEPWTRASRPLAWDAAAKIVADGFARESISWGVTGIGYASGKKLGPLVRAADYMVPQCYSVAGNTLNPKTAAVKLSNLWRDRFGDRRLVVGLAAYSQRGRPGFTQEEFMRAAFDSARSSGATDIVYWSLRQIRGSRTTANIIAGLAKKSVAVLDGRIS